MCKANSSKANYLYHSTPLSVQKDEMEEEQNEENHDGPGSPIHAGFAVPPRRRVSTPGSIEEEDDELIFDLGSQGIGCGRRADGIKLFLTWKYMGSKGFASRVDHAMKLAQSLRHKVAQHPRLELVFPLTLPSDEREQGANVCFWYVPEPDESPDRTRALWRSQLTQDPLYKRRMATLTLTIRAEMIKRGKAMIDFAPLPAPQGLPNFFRVPLNSTLVTEAHLDQLIDEVVFVGNQVVRQEVPHSWMQFQL
jgi:hypothetical protein